MKCILTVFAMMFLLVTSETTEAADPSSSPAPAQAKESPFESISFLIGGSWRGELPPGPNDTPVSIEFQAEWLPNRQGIGFNGTYVSKGSRMPYTSGSYFWNAAKRQLIFVYSDNEGGLTEGTVTAEGSGLRHDFTITDAHGKIKKARAIITPLGHDAYTNEIMLEKDGSWEKVVTVKYHRLYK